MILSFESSCDESAVAIFDPASGVACDLVHSQIELHSGHGGVVPDIATREHLKRFGPLFNELTENAAWDRISSMAVTRGPGLAACLAIGVAAAKSLAFALRIPLVGVNHLRAHAWSPFIPVHAVSAKGFEESLPALLPHLGLIVSGGNTILFSISEARVITQISATRDDAAGEALDKGAKLLGIGYPGGPEIERRAADGKADAFDFPRGIGKRGDLDFSFSGLKTSLRYRIQGMSEDAVRASMADLCASYQAAVVDALAARTASALALGEYRSVGLSGGVANNKVLREAIADRARDHGALFMPANPRHSGDNAAMIGFAAWIDAADAGRYTGRALRVDPSAYL